jgi:hypothetical protein
MQKVEQICRRGTEALDSRPVEGLDRVDHLLLRIAAETGIEKVAKGNLVLAVVRNARLRLPHERMVGALEYLSLFGN